MSHESVNVEEQCIYCGSSERITQDHVPPQCLFGDVPTSELIAVPGCLTCNNAFARDDEFLRDLIVTATLHVDMPELAAPRAALRRSLTRPKHAGPPYIAHVVSAALSGEERAIGGRRFGYCYRLLSDDPLGSVWLLSFLGQLVFLCTAGRR